MLGNMVELVKMLEYLSKNGRLYDWVYHENNGVLVQVSGDDGIKDFLFEIC